MRVALYARVSTAIGQSPEMQLVELREYASRRGWEIFREYVDHGISGSKESRPALNHLMADAHMRHFDVVLCWKWEWQPFTEGSVGPGVISPWPLMVAPGLRGCESFG